jgi:anti-anti-sigma regulatory factor
VGGSLALVSTDGDILRVFKVTGLDKMIEVHDSVEGALTAAA